jgi:hypothetical protein
MTKDHRRVDAQMAQDVLLDDPAFLREIVERVVQQILEAEMSEHIGAAPYERAEKRTGHRNGHKPRTLRTRVGTLNLLVPEDREGTFSTRLFSRYQRNEKALCLALRWRCRWRVFRPGRSRRSQRSCAEPLSPRASCPPWPAPWTRSLKGGGTASSRPRPTLTCSSMPATRR